MIPGDENKILKIMYKNNNYYTAINLIKAMLLPKILTMESHSHKTVGY